MLYTLFCFIICSLSLSLLPLRGIGSVIVDYVPSSLQMIAKLLVSALTLVSVGGLIYLTHNDIGVCNAIRMLWTIN